MSHFTVAVLIPEGTEDWQAKLDELLAPYDETREVEPYQEPCYCAADGPRPDCDECGGTGQYMSTYNPRSKWDWWVVGGRWSGAINGGDSGPVRELPEGYRPHALLTPEGAWHERGRMGWWGVSHDNVAEDRWAAEVAELLSSYPTATVIQLDCHI